MMQFSENMREKVLPESFVLTDSSFSFEDEDEFVAALSNAASFLHFVEEKWDYDCTRSYSDVFFSGFLGSYALALWFMQFDEDNWFSFDDVHRETEKYLNSYSSISERKELRMIKGSFLPMKLDLPVVVDYENMSFTVWTGELKD